MPQVGDIDGNGHLDVISGANCCDSSFFHWFERSADNKFLDQKTGRMVFGKIDPPRLGKQESRPYIVDWDRDGNSDIVIAM